MRAGAIRSGVRQQITISLLTITLAYCTNHNAHITSHSKEQKLGLDTSTIAILPIDNIKEWLPQDAKSLELSNADLSDVDRLLKRSVDDDRAVTEPDARGIGFQLKDLSKYKRQYLPFRDSRGHKQVLVNCFCNHHGHDWHREFVYVPDGGSCYFRVVIDLTGNDYHDFRVNGNA